jgi:hypothetical protein
MSKLIDLMDQWLGTYKKPDELDELPAFFRDDLVEIEKGKLTTSYKPRSYQFHGSVKQPVRRIHIPTSAMSESLYHRIKSEREHALIPVENPHKINYKKVRAENKIGRCFVYSV